MQDDTLPVEKPNWTYPADPDRRSLGRRLRFNASSKLLAEVIGRALQFLLLYQAQLALGPALYGQFTYAMALGFVLAQPADLGLQLIVTREIARDELRAAHIVGTGLTLKLIITIGIGVLLLNASLTRPTAAQLATLVLGLALVVNSFVEFLGYTFRGLQRVEYEAALVLSARVLITILGSVALWSGLGLAGLSGAYLLGGGLALGLGYLVLRKRFFTPALIFDRVQWRELLREALPLGGAVILSIAYTRTSVFLLDALHGATATGLYGVAQKLTEPLALIPAALMAAVFPAFIQAARREANASSGGEAAWLRSRSIGWLAGAGIALAGIGALGGPWLIEHLYPGQYAGSAVALQLLALALLPAFVNYALTHFLIAHGRQKLNLLFNAVIFVLNLALCFALIPRFGPAGAAAAVVISECVLFALCGYALARSRNALGSSA
ncbi:MAG TPA: flippase [Anaerolineae bacterium]|nr:flippase [Anaerolineae bacterium]